MIVAYYSHLSRLVIDSSVVVLSLELSSLACRSSIRMPTPLLWWFSVCRPLHFWVFIPHGSDWTSPFVHCLITFACRCDNRRLRQLGAHCLGMCAVAVTIWICDRVFCSFWLSISFPYLHSIWHVLILFSSNEAIVVGAYLLIKHQSPHANLVLHAWPNEQWGSFSLPYLQFHEGEDNDTLIPSSSSFGAKSIV